MVRVGLDTSALHEGFKEHASRGIGRYVSELHRYLQDYQDTGVQVGEFDFTRFQGNSCLDSVVERIPVGRATIRQQVLYPLRLGGVREFDVLHFPAHMDAPSWAAKKYILTVLDLIPLVCRDLYRADRPGWRFTFARWLEARAIKNATMILTISENTARDVEKIMGVSRDRIRVTPLGVDKKFFEVSREDPHQDLRVSLSLPPDRPIVLYVGGIDQRKNISGLLRTFQRVRTTCRELNQALPVLVMAGRIEQDRQFPRLQALQRELDLEADIICTGYLDDPTLLALYAMADVFFFPSLYEGFGLPPLEALAAGTPVVSSNTSAMPEVLMGAAELVAPEDYEQAAEKILTILNNKEYAQQLSLQGRAHAAQFSWEQTGKRTLEAYHEFSKAD